MRARIPASKVLSDGLIGKTIPGFPYPEKRCVYCNKEMFLVKAVHIQNAQENFKAIFVCYNESCEAYDEPAQRAYVKVYYSSQTAAELLDGILLHFDAPRKR